jgi:hypothetical protein
MKRGWFPDKKTCLKHCEQHKADGPMYLYKRIVIPDKWLPFLNKYQSFRWEVKADRTILIGPWFQNPKSCIRHFKNMLREGYDVADCCETTHYLVMRRVLRDHKRWLRYRKRPTLDISNDHTGLHQEE